MERVAQRAGIDLAALITTNPDVLTNLGAQLAGRTVVMCNPRPGRVRSSDAGAAPPVPPPVLTPTPAPVPVPATATTKGKPLLFKIFRGDADGTVRYQEYTYDPAAASTAYSYPPRVVGQQAASGRRLQSKMSIIGPDNRRPCAPGAYPFSAQVTAGWGEGSATQGSLCHQPCC